MKPLAAGNWKMNGLKASVSELGVLRDKLDGTTSACDVMICPPATLVMALADAAEGSAIQIGGQDCHSAVSGAHTGDVSAAMLKDAGAAAVIVGHSERRADHGETSELVKAKAQAAIGAGLVAIVCLGETLAEREAGETLSVVHGSGLTPTPDQVAEVHQAIRAGLSALTSAEEAHQIRILYGGSVKPSNAAELMAIDPVDGALGGGASLKADDFAGIIAAF